MLLPQIRNLRSVADYRRKQMRLKKAIRTGVAVDDEANTSSKLAAEQIKQNILPVMPNQDLLEASSRDKSKQYNTALEHLKSIMSGNDATTVLRAAFPDLEQLQELNRHWGTFRRSVGDTKMSPQYFFQYWNRFRQILQATDNTGMFIPLQKGDIAEDFFGGPGGVGRPPGGASGPSQGGPGGNGGDGGDGGGGGGGGGGYGDGGGGGGGGGDPFPGFKPPSSAPSSTPASPRRAGEEKKEEESQAPPRDYSEQNEASTPEANFVPNTNPGFYPAAYGVTPASLKLATTLNRIGRRRGLQGLKNNMYQEVPTTYGEFFQTGMRTKLVKKPPLPKPPTPEEFTAINVPTDDADVAAEELRKFEEREKKKIDEEKRRQDEAVEAERRKKEAEEAEAERRKKENAEKAAEDERRKKVLEEQRKKEAAARAERKKEAERKKKEDDELREVFRKAEAQRKAEDEARREDEAKKEAERKKKEEKESNIVLNTEQARYSFQELQRQVSNYFKKKSARYNLPRGEGGKRDADLISADEIDEKRQQMISDARRILTGSLFFDGTDFVNLKPANKVNIPGPQKKKMLTEDINKVFEDLEKEIGQQPAWSIGHSEIKRAQNSPAEEYRLRREEGQRRQEAEAIREKLAKDEAEKEVVRAADRELKKKQKAALLKVEARLKSLNNKRTAAAAAAKKVLKAKDKPRAAQAFAPTNVGKPGNEESKEESKTQNVVTPPRRSKMTPPRVAPQKRAPNPLTPPPPKKMEKAGEETPMNVDQAEKPEAMDVVARGRYTIEQIARTQPMSDLYSNIGDIYMDDIENAINSYTEAQREQALRDAGFRPNVRLNTKAKRLKVIDTLRKNTGEGSPRSPKTRSEKKRVGKNIKFGGGISAPSEPRYDQFGCYLIHVPSLSKNRLNIKFPSLASHPKIPQRIVSDELVALITKILETGQMNAPLYAALPQSDKDFFDSLAHMCKIGGKLGIVKKENNADMQRFQIVRGEILSGNDAPQLIKELKHLTLKLVTEGKIPKRSAHDLLIEISLL